MLSKYDHDDLHQSVFVVGEKSAMLDDRFALSDLEGKSVNIDTQPCINSRNRLFNLQTKLHWQGCIHNSKIWHHMVTP